MNKFKKITGLLLAFAFFINIGSPVVMAKEDTEAEQECKDLKPDYNTLEKGWSEIDLNSRSYKKLFETVQEDYHNYVGCFFDYAEHKIYKTGAARTSGIVKAYTPNTYAINWMIPEQACLGSTEILDIINTTSPRALLAPVLQAHTDYKNYLDKLGRKFVNTGTERAGEKQDGQKLQGAQALIAKAAAIGIFERQRQMEIDSALVAIDLSFSALKELRLAFVMHVHFQCSLKYLEKYRKALEKLRKLIQPLPNQLRDASVVK